MGESDHFGHNKIREVSSYTVKMQEHARPWLPAWAVVLVALCIPLVIAFGFLVVFDMANPPISGIGYESDPSIGQRIASRNDALIFLHAVARRADSYCSAESSRHRTELECYFS
jgi:hypothetical protein